MPEHTFERELPTDREELYAWHTRPGAFDRLRPPWQRIEVVQPGAVVDGSRVRIALGVGPLRIGWTAEHRDVVPGHGFTDFQRSGPFARWVHRHEFEDIAGGALLRDRIDYELRGGRIGEALAGERVRRDMTSTFTYRQETTARDLARHEAFRDRPRLKVALSGAGGLVGTNLAAFLTTGGHEVLRLVRGEAAAEGEIAWQPESGLVSPASAPAVDAVIHLAGENIADGRWTTERKRRIRDSRVEGTRRLVRSLAEMPGPPSTFVCASAIGFYGSRGDELLDETSDPGGGFLAEVCREWEAAAEEATELGMRVASLRFGVILTPAGGALAKMLPPFRLGAGGRLGDGRQYMSWISIDDTVGAIHQALMDDRLRGPVNVVAPRAVTNREFTAALGRVLRRPTIFPVPAFGARALFGEMADEMLLSSTRVRPGRLEQVGFTFADPELEPALAHLLGKSESS
jgi:uncharacterized protein (TIGR01777 family)